MSTAIYLIGPPAAGKSTVMRALTARWGPGTERAEPIPHHAWGERVELGRRNRAFPGTDALSYAVVTAAVSWVASPGRPRVMLGEGDRLANSRFLDALSGYYDTAHVVHLTTDPTVLRERAVQRADEMGVRPQAESWWIGRMTKCMRLAARYSALTLDATVDPILNADTLADMVEREI